MRQRGVWGASAPQRRRRRRKFCDFELENMHFRRPRPRASSVIDRAGPIHYPIANPSGSGTSVAARRAARPCHWISPMAWSHGRRGCSKCGGGSTTPATATRVGQHRARMRRGLPSRRLSVSKWAEHVSCPSKASKRCAAGSGMVRAALLRTQRCRGGRRRRTQTRAESCACAGCRRVPLG